MIEKDIPIPGYYPFADMKVGDSMVITVKKRQALAVAMIRHALKNNMKFISRKIGDDSYRVWRVK